MPDVIYRINGGALALLENQTSPTAIAGDPGDVIEAWVSDKRTATVLGGSSGALIEGTSTGSAGEFGATSSTLAVTLPAGSTTGDLILIYAVHSDTGGWTGATLSLTGGTGWTSSARFGTSPVRAYTFHKVLTGSGDSVTISASAAGAMSYLAVRISNPGAFFTAGVAVASGTTFDPPELDCGTAANRIWMTACLTYNSEIDYFQTWPSGYTENQILYAHPPGHYSHPIIGFVAKTANAQTENPSQFVRVFAGDRSGAAFTSAVTV